MFRQLARVLKNNTGRTTGVPAAPVKGNPAKVFLYHPVELADFLETAWAFRDRGKSSKLPELTDAIVSQCPRIGWDMDPVLFRDGLIWHHLIYAYMIENTRILDVFEKVVFEFTHGEKLGYPTSFGTQSWLRASEELFFKHHHFSAFALSSQVRPDMRASRRNAYYRMFGMDLNHGGENNQPYPYHKSKASNQEFTSNFETFLREAWIGIKYRKVTIGANDTNSTAIIDTAVRLRDMLQSRRKGGNLSREEFFYVAAMSWFHLTVEYDSFVVGELRTQAANPYERLKKIGERVDVPVHPMAENYFKLAEPMSRLLFFIERHLGNHSAEVFYMNKNIRDDIEAIITYWSSATGKNLKEKSNK